MTFIHVFVYIFLFAAVHSSKLETGQNIIYMMPDDPPPVPGDLPGQTPSSPCVTIPNLSLPLVLEVDGPGIKERWAEWKDSWNRYLLLSGINRQPKEFQCALLLHSIGQDARRIYNGMSFLETDNKNDVAVVIQKYDEHFLTVTRDFIERIKFYRRCQNADEPFEQFLSELRNLAKPCNFCACMSDTLIMDRIIIGHKDEKVRDRLTCKDKLDLKTVLNICRSMEVTAENRKVVKNETEEFVNKMSHNVYKRGTKKTPDSSHGSSYSSHGSSCKFCAFTHEFRKEKCPAFGKVCRACGRKNHFAKSKMCPSNSRHASYKQRPNINALGENAHGAGNENNDDADESDTSGSVCMVNTNHVSALSDPKSRPLYCKMLIGEEHVVHQIDPGATVCVLPVKYVRPQAIRPEVVALKMWNGSTVTALGKCKVKVRNVRTGEKWNVDYVIVDDARLVPLLSRRAAETMQLITVNYEKFETVNNVKQACSDFIKQFPDVFDDKLGTLPGGKVHLTVQENAEPVVRPARTLPESRKVAVKAELDRLVQVGVIAKVDQPTDWVNQMSIAEKASGEMRICLDPIPLNAVLKREYFRLPILEDILPKLSGTKKFSVCDLRHGYWHCELDEEASYLTTFATSFGRYRWIRLPFGLNVSSEIFQKRLCSALEGLEGVQCVADDVIVYGVSDTDHDEKMINFLKCCKMHGIKLNPEKCQFRLKEIRFLGHVISAGGLKPDPAKVEAVLNMQKPNDVEAVHRLKGTVGYLARYVPKLSEVISPINKLTHKDVSWCWGCPQEDAFNELKRLLTQAPTLAYFDPDKQLIIQCDASEAGLGAALLQENRPIAYASRALTEVESRYSIMEKEMLSIVFALEKWHQFTYGRPVIVHSDHKPLQSITRKPLDRAPKRLQGMLLRALAYNINVKYMEGKKMFLADTLSRAFLPQNASQSEQIELETINAVTYLPMRSERVEEIRRETANDPKLAQLADAIQRDWPVKGKVPPVIADFYGIRDELAVCDGLVFRGERLVIPLSMKKQTMKEVHSSHSGVDGCLRLAREYVYWPGMTNDIRQTVQRCEVCREFDVSQPKETLECTDVPERPWQMVGTDLLTFDQKSYIVTVCYYSHFWELNRLYDISAKGVIRKLKTHFARYGKPDVLVSDCGPQFTAGEFVKFVRDWDIAHRTSSPHHHQSNGKAESAVKAAKKLLLKTSKSGEDFYIALLQSRNVPQQKTGLSPAQMLMGRRTRANLPTSQNLLKPAADDQHVVETIKEGQARQKRYYDRTAKDLPALQDGDIVRIKPVHLGEKSWKKGIITERVGLRSYNVMRADGQNLRRNRRHLRRTHEPTPVEDGSEEDEYVSHQLRPPNVVIPETGSAETEGSIAIPTATLTRSNRVIRQPQRYPDHESRSSSRW